MILYKSFWSLDQNELFKKVSIMELFFSERIWTKFGHGSLREKTNAKLYSFVRNLSQNLYNY